MGNTVNFRTKKISYKDKNSVHNSPEDWIIFENTQEAIQRNEHLVKLPDCPIQFSNNCFDSFFSIARTSYPTWIVGIRSIPCSL